MSHRLPDHHVRLPGRAVPPERVAHVALQRGHGVAQAAGKVVEGDSAHGGDASTNHPPAPAQPGAHNCTQVGCISKLRELHVELQAPSEALAHAHIHAKQVHALCPGCLGRIHQGGHPVHRVAHVTTGLLTYSAEAGIEHYLAIPLGPSADGSAAISGAVVKVFGDEGAPTGHCAVPQGGILAQDGGPHDGLHHGGLPVAIPGIDGPDEGHVNAPEHAHKRRDRVSRPAGP